MDDPKLSLLPLLPSSSALTFGNFTLKSGRISPYFFNSSLLYTASLHHAVCSSYASVLSSTPFTSSSASSQLQGEEGTLNAEGVPKYDVLFGPAYKGIVLAGSILPLLLQSTSQQNPASSPPTATLNPFANISYAYNRKEAKAHGEGGSLVGAPVKGKRVVIVDDVITAGTAVREAVDLIHQQGGIVVGVVVLLDRQERVSDSEPRSALRIVSEELGVPVKAVVQFADLIEAIEHGQMPGAGKEELERMKEYRSKYQSQG